jgi:hypothetical protein
MMYEFYGRAPFNIVLAGVALSLALLTMGVVIGWWIWG